jgi:hypothetical protein
VWESASDEDVVSSQREHAPSPADDIEHELESATESDEGHQRKVKCVDKVSEGIELDSASDKNGSPDDGIENEWSSASENDDGEAVGPNMPQVSTNSELLVSPSRITLPHTGSLFPLSDNWPSFEPIGTIALSVLPSNEPFHHFVPEDFNNLEDHMFEDGSESEEDM